jgi:protein SCO1
MTTKRLVLLLVVAMAVTVTVVQTGRGTPAEPRARTFQVSGVVTSPVAEGHVVVAHDDIPGYMPAMTMPFTVGADVTPPLAAGDRVRFTLRVTADSSRAEQFRVTGHDAGVTAPRAETRQWPKRLKKGDEIPTFSLTTAEGQPLTPADLRGHVTAITFVFTRCPVPEFCPLMVKRFQELQRELESSDSQHAVRLLSVTLDPAFDTPQVLRDYAISKGANPARWQFATGEPGEIVRLTAAFSIHVEQKGVLIDHTLATAVIGRDGRIVEIWRGNGWSPAELVDVIRRSSDTRAALRDGSRHGMIQKPLRTRD